MKKILLISMALLFCSCGSDPSHPTDDGDAGESVGTEPQTYRIGNGEQWGGIVCDHDGGGVGQTLHWYRGRCRQEPEPPGTLVADP